jgi:tRNA dimethylallyltransferase
LEPSDRAVLHQRIALRFDQMLGERDDEGIVAEVARLRARGDLSLNLPSMRCVGYRQSWEYLDGMYDRKQLRENGIVATRQLAKRQLTWLRAMPERIVVDCLAKDATGQVLGALDKHIRSG